MSSAELFSPKVAGKRPPATGPDRVDVVLVKLESVTTPPRVAPPFGILYVASALEKAGFSVKLIHRNGTRAAIEEIARDIIDAGTLAFFDRHLRGGTAGAAVLALCLASALTLTGCRHNSPVVDQVLDCGREQIQAQLPHPMPQLPIWPQKKR